MTIAWKLRILAVALVVITALAVALAVYRGYGTLIERRHRQSLVTHAQTQALRLESAFAELGHDIQLLSGLPLVRRVARESRGAAVADGEGRADADELAAVFESLMGAKAYYMQARYIGAERGGREVVRVDRRDGRIVRTPEQELQEKGGRDYVREALALPAGSIYFSDIELNREHGRVQVPHLPTFRAAAPVLCEGETTGLVVINLDFGALARDLFREEPPGHTHYLCNGQGDFLLHPDSARAFGFDLGSRHRLRDEFPEAAEMPPGTGRAIMEVAATPERPRSLLHVEELRIFPNAPERRLVLAIAASRADLDASVASINARTLALACVVVVGAVLAAYVLALLISRPLSRMTEAADELASDRRPPPLPVGRSDEIGTLARAFERMVGVLQLNESRLRRSNADLEQFAFTASHDLQEPLRMVTCYAELLEGACAGRLDAEASEFLQYVHDGARRMKRLVDGLLDFSRVEGRGHTFEWCSGQEILDDVLEDLTVARKESGAHIQCDRMPRLYVDRGQIGRVFQNLIGNAIKFNRGPSRIRIGVARAGDFWQFTVEDDGIGFPPQDAERIFQIFQRLHDHREFEGSGIGLSVSRRIIQRHGGRMWATSEPGVGSRFFFTLPVEPQSVAAPPSEWGARHEPQATPVGAIEAP